MQHLEAENQELRETVKRMLNPQWRYLLYGEQIPAAEEIQQRPNFGREPTHIKIPPRKTWKQISSQIEYLVSPQAVIDKKQSEREEAIKEAMNG